MANIYLCLASLIYLMTFEKEGFVQDIGHSALNIPQCKPNDGESLDSYRESVQIET